MLIYLDNCCYNRPFDDQEQVRIHIETIAKLHIQELIKTGKLKLACSFISRFENSENPNESNRESIAAFFQNAVIYIESAHFDEIKKKRDEYMAKGIKMKDATHLACAVKAGCQYFLTTDDRFIKRCKEMKIAVCNPVTFLELIEGEADA